jgi:5,6-dimethylbenzimidazole synthase
MTVDTSQRGSNPTTLEDAIFTRRDVRREFTGEPVAQEQLVRILKAGHAAPSVGMTQPWDFIIVDEEAPRRAFHAHVEKERQLFADSLDAERAKTFAKIKIDGVLDASLGLVVTYDAQRGSPAVLGRYSIADAGLYSVCLAIQNLWLTATAEGWGVGWVSFYREPFLQELLGIPENVRPIAWLCVGPVSHLEKVPDLERFGWQARRPVDDLLHWNSWAERGVSSSAIDSRATLGGKL